MIFRHLFVASHYLYMSAIDMAVQSGQSLAYQERNPDVGIDDHTPGFILSVFHNVLVLRLPPPV